jgi:hypothetical protein
MDLEAERCPKFQRRAVFELSFFNIIFADRFAIILSAVALPVL